MSRYVSSARRRVGPILLVDDYDDARASVRDALEDAGHVVVEATNGQEALNFLVSNPNQHVAAIILDLQMPVMDGWHFVELLRCYVRLSHIPVIIVTAQEPHLEQIAYKALFGCVRAPYQMDELLRMVDACIDPDGQEQAARDAR